MTAKKWRSGGCGKKEFNFWDTFEVISVKIYLMFLFLGFPSIEIKYILGNKQRKR